MNGYLTMVVGIKSPTMIPKSCSCISLLAAKNCKELLPQNCLGFEVVCGLGFGV